MFKVLAAAVAAAILSLPGAASAATYVDTALVDESGGYAFVNRAFDWGPGSIYLQPGSTYEISITLTAGSFDVVDLQFYDILQVGRIQSGQFYSDYLDIYPQECPSARCAAISASPSEVRFRFSTVSPSRIDPWPTSDTAFVYGVMAAVGYAIDVYAPGEQAVTIVTTISAVPEPATWAMMITGFGLAGAAIRLRRPHQSYGT